MRERGAQLPDRGEVEALLVAPFGLASAAVDTSPPISDWVLARAEAVALTDATASLAQEVFAVVAP